ncbi:MFS transporter [Pseudooceanicola algae]|uniref:Inner membrane protein YbjJ n=1 Tax=Pseudooceanicola algae TaxID=1537215 RepID=A0A418SGN4_9RHOB|nr:MFS transporter [Pseudooceanicola algae]QPM88919.1 Inner membrane protein YbjJ [Pseudooceanicola algae]
MTSFLTPWRSAAAAFALNGMLIGSWAARVPAVMQTHELSNGRFGLYLLVMGIGALLSFPLAGRLSDRLGAARVTSWCALAYLATLVLIGLAPGPWGLAVILALFGASHGSMDVTMNAWATEVEKQMGRSVLSSIHAMWSFGAGAGAALGFGATALGLSVAAHFALVSALALASLWPMMRGAVGVRRTPAPETGPRRRPPVFAVPRGALVPVGIFALAAGLGEGAMADWSAVFLHEVTGMAEAPAALGYALFALAMVAMRLVVDRLITRAGPVIVARASALTAALGLALAVGVATGPAALLGFVLTGLGYAALIPLAFSRAAADPEVPTGQAIAGVSTLGYGAMLLGPTLIGQISEWASLRLAFGLLGGVALCVAAMAPILSRKP